MGCADSKRALRYTCPLPWPAFAFRPLKSDASTILRLVLHDCTRGAGDLELSADRAVKGVVIAQFRGQLSTGGVTANWTRHLSLLKLSSSVRRFSFGDFA